MAVAASLDLRMVEMDRRARSVKRESKVSTAWERRSKLSIMTANEGQQLIKGMSMD